MSIFLIIKAFECTYLRRFVSIKLTITKKTIVTRDKIKFQGKEIISYDILCKGQPKIILKY